ncbi:MAG: biliverdin-producing heme oxygenase [Planctomycetes bacterium]|nr:biliverdin-producing heme oxygenase [Planctomycetota bacterium]
MATTHIHARLRAATRALHARVEACGPFGRLASGDFARADYRAALEVLLAVARPLERCPALAAGRVERLVADLRALGAEPEAVAPAALQPPAGEAEVLGARYVLEGSALGASVLLRRLGERLGLAPGAPGCSYLGAVAAGAEQRWPAFLRHLAERVDAGVDAERTVAAAVGLFEVLVGCARTAQAVGR